MLVFFVVFFSLKKKNVITFDAHGVSQLKNRDMQLKKRRDLLLTWKWKRFLRLIFTNTSKNADGDFLFFFPDPSFVFNAIEIQAGLCRMLEGSACYQQGRAGARTVDREADSVSRCCPESGSRILGLFVLPVTWCHCDRCSTRCVPYGQLGSDGEKGLFYKTQIVTRSQIKYCCL